MCSCSDPPALAKATWLEGRHCAAARKAINRHDVAGLPRFQFGTRILHETGRLKPTASKLMALLDGDVGLRVLRFAIPHYLDHARRELARNPFDRLIVANAKGGGSAGYLRRADR